MNAIIRMAIRNIGRNRRRSVLAVLSVTLAIMFIVFMQGFIEGEIESMVRNYTRQESGHIRITTRAFHDKAKFMPVTDNIRSADSIVAVVKALPGVGKEITMTAQRFMFGVLLSHDGNNKSGLAIAGDPAVEKELILFNRALLPGSRYIEGEREMIMGARLADALGYAVGDTVDVMTQGADFALHLRKFRLVGVFRTMVSTIDETMFQIGLEDARKLLRARDAVQQIFIFLDNYRTADRYTALIRDALNDTSLSVASWTGVGASYQLVKVTDSMFNFFFGIIALLGAFIISNIMMMVVMERRREIGILKSMGLRRGEIVMMFLMEGTALGLAGSVLGVAGGLIINAVLGVVGMDFSKVMEQITIPIDSVIYPEINPLAMVRIFIIGVFVSALMAWVPARRAGKLNPVDTMKSV